MPEFAFQVEGETVGRWVLAIDPVGDRLLVTNDEKSLLWVELSQCKFLKARNPELPVPVVVVQEPKQLTIPSAQRQWNG